MNIFIRLVGIINVVAAIQSIQQQKSNITLLRKEIDDNNFYFTCIVEGNIRKSALTWITPLESYEEVKASNYSPTSKLLCDYEDETAAKKWIPSGWTIHESADFTFKRVTDYRWENFPIHSSSKNVVLSLGKFKQNNFSTNLSFRIKKNAKLYLCGKNEDEFPEYMESKCYVVFIEKTKISIKKEESECSNSTHIKELDENQWAHLNIKNIYNVNSHSTTLKISIDMETIICKSEWTEPERRLLVRSEETSVWKIHNYRFLSTNKTTVMTPVGEKINIATTKLCISLYVALCSTCAMTITVDSDQNNDEEPYVIKEIIFKKVENGYVNEKTGGTFLWKEIKVTTDINETQPVLLYISANNSNGSAAGFWALDDIRLCDANEIRVSNLRTAKNSAHNIKCQSLYGNSISISEPKPSIICADPTKIGGHCNITCASIFGANQQYCEKNVICTQENGYENSNCYCAIGYQGPACRDTCSEGKWGVACSKKCINCKNNNCNPISGMCIEGCVAGFDEVNCTHPELVKNIRTTKTTANSIILEWDPPALSSEFTFTYIVHHKFKKYKACGKDSPAEWSTTDLNKARLELEDLLPYSEYLYWISAKIGDLQGNDAEYIAVTNYTEDTGSEEAPLNLEILNSYDTTATIIKWQEQPCSKIKGPLTYKSVFKCLNEWCKNDDLPARTIPYSNRNDTYIDLQAFISDFKFHYSDYSVVMSLSRDKDPHTNYGFTFYENTFKTKAIEPPQVRDLETYSCNETTISLRWKPPYPPNGLPEKYLVTCVGENKCKRVVTHINHCELWENYTCADLTGLSENMKYIVQVEAKNFGVETYGKNERLTDIFTQQSESDPPENVDITWDKDVPSLHWDHPWKTNGPLVHFTIEINTTSETINHVSFYNVTIENYKQTYFEKMSYLNYSTTNHVQIYAVNKFKGKPSKSKCINMPPPTPKLLTVPSLHYFKLKIEQPVNKSRKSYLYVIVDSNQQVQEEDIVNTTQLLDSINKNYSKRKTKWLAIAMPISNNTNKFINVELGDGTKTDSKRYGIVTNRPLNNDTNYIVTVIIANYYLKKTRFSERYNVHSAPSERMTALGETTRSSSALYALFLLLLIPAAIFGFICYNRNKEPNLENGQHRSLAWIPSWLQRNGNGNENLPLHTTVTNAQTKQSQKQIAIINPNYSDQAGASSPLLKQNVTEDIQLRCRVQLEDYEEYVKQSIGTNEDGELVRQHNLFVRGQRKPWDYGLKKQNKFKNRYNNLIAYDHSRVKLEKINNDQFSDYINANYIDGYKAPKAYIATQGPKPTTVSDFWRMIWQECVTTIVMVANVEEDGKKKTEEYWPKLDNSVEYGSIHIHQDKSEIFSNYVFRTLIVTLNNEQRIIEQFHFTSWPDHSVPLYPQSLVPFVKKLLAVPQDSAPIVVHCSAGVGRTGTIILCDFILRMAAREDSVDFLETLQQMREQRANLVDNPNQYKLAHLVVLEALFGLDTTIACDHELEKRVDKLINSNGIQEQMDYLDKIVWQDQAMRTSYKSPVDPANKLKNRFSNIIPDGHGNVYISRYPVSDEHSDYINAVEVDGFQTPQRFIVTQQPLPNTMVDFWRMVSEKEVTTIVSLNEFEPHDESSCVFWPQEDEVLELQFATIHYVDKEEYYTHDVIKIILIYTTKEDDECRRNITVVSMKSWPALKTTPENLESLLAVWEETDKVSRSDNPIVVVCYDGAKASGVFVALSFVIEKIKLEQVCDVCLAVRTIRYNREQFVTNVQQFELLYRAAVLYLKSFETYSNFPINK